MVGSLVSQTYAHHYQLCLGRSQFDHVDLIFKIFGECSELASTEAIRILVNLKGHIFDVYKCSSSL